MVIRAVLGSILVADKGVVGLHDKTSVEQAGQILDVHVRQNVLVVVPHGEWDASTAAIVGPVLVATQLSPVVVIDLAHLRFVDLRGVTPLERLARNCAGHGRRVFVVNPRHGPELVLRFVGLAPLIVPVEHLPAPDQTWEALLRSGTVDDIPR